MDSALFDDVEDYHEAHPSLPAERSAEMPMLWDQEHCRLIDSCVRSESLYELYLQLPRLAADLEVNQTLKDNGFAVEEMAQPLKDHDWSMLELLHSMPRDVVQSIVKNTVAFDLAAGETSFFPMPQSSGEVIPGVFVVGLSIAGHHGKFLNIQEMEHLIAEMKEYVFGYKAHAKFVADEALHGNQFATSNQSSDEAHARRHVLSVDSRVGWTATATELAFIGNEEEILSIEALIKTYENMCNRSLDAEGTTRMLQSPLFVGCSEDLYECTKVYAQNSVKDLDKPLGLTVSILSKLGFPVELRVSNALRVWMDGQLPKAEQLVATLAGSLLFQHGFNVTEAGGPSSTAVVDPEALRTNVAHIFSGTKTMLMNLDATLREADLRHRWLKDLARIRGQVIEMTEWLDKCDETLKSLPPGTEWRQTIDELQEVVDDFEKSLKVKKEALHFWNVVLRIQQIVVEETGYAIDLGLEDSN